MEDVYNRIIEPKFTIKQKNAVIAVFSSGSYFVWLLFGCLFLRTCRHTALFVFPYENCIKLESSELKRVMLNNAIEMQVECLFWRLIPMTFEVSTGRLMTARLLLF